ncbi:MAG: cupin domain-containing protein [Elusimicrobia bacterium]|nr:cupin domain-containing protein [Elusimicrobiota bacterium]
MIKLAPLLVLAFAPVFARAAETAAPASAPVIKSSGDIDYHASGSLPPGAEYHLIYEEPKTHAVQTIVRMPRGYVLPPHRHSYDETIFVLKGKVVLGFGDRSETLSAGGYAVVPAETVFTMKIEGFGGAQFLAAFNGPFDAKMAAPAAKP